MHMMELTSRRLASDIKSEHEVRYRPHQSLYLDGDPAHSVFRVTSGVVIVYRLLPDGRRQIYSFATQGDFLALDLGHTYRHYAEAITEVSVEVYERTSFEQALQRDADFRRAIFSYLTESLLEAQEQAVLLGCKSALERTASFLCFLYEKSPARAPGAYIVIRMSRSDIADYLGLTFETVSRMLHRMKDLGVIDLPKPDRFKVLDWQALAKLAGKQSAQRWVEPRPARMPGLAGRSRTSAVEGASRLRHATDCRPVDSSIARSH